ncbi:MAG: hypothetical protein Q9227_002730 [Pyrenula ochraceoflavens]
MPPRVATRRQKDAVKSEDTSDQFISGGDVHSSADVENTSSIGDSLLAESQNLDDGGPDDMTATANTHVPPSQDTISGSNPSLPSNIPKKSFRTRAGVTRRTAADREAALKAEEERRQERAAQAPAKRGRASRARGRPPQSRLSSSRSESQSAAGNTTSETFFAPSKPQKAKLVQGSRGAADEPKEPKEPSDPTGLAEPANLFNDSAATTTGGGAPAEEVGLPSIEAAEPTEKAKGKRKADGRNANAAGQKKEQAFLTFEDDEYGEKRRDIEDIERIEISDDEEADEDVLPRSAGSNRNTTQRLLSRTKKLGLRPVRAYTHEHVPRSVGFATGLKRVREDEKHVKIEDTGADLIPDEGFIGVDQQSPSVKLRRRSTSADDKAAPKTRKPRKEGLRDSGPRSTAPEALEERDERERFEVETEMLCRALRGQLDTVRGLDEDGSEGARRAPPPLTRPGGLFLMQFPPLTPMLIDPLEQQQQGQQPSVRNSDPSALSNTSVDLPDQSFSHITKPSKPSSSSVKVKQEPSSGVDVQITHSNQPPLTPKFVTAASSSSSTALPSGRVGTLKVHKSGKVSLDWGGVDMNVNWGTSAHFPQDLVLASEEAKETGSNSHNGRENDGEVRVKQEEKEDDERWTGQGMAWLLPQVREKLIVTPDWGKVFR